MTAYAVNATENVVSSLGVHVSEAAMAAFDDEMAVDLRLPAKTAAGHPLDLGQFTFVRFKYTHGHWPEGTYDVPHFDVHFFMLDRPAVAEIESRPADYAIPDAQLPGGHVRPLAVDTDDDGEPDAPLVESKRGEPVANPNVSEFRTDGEFTHTHIYGASDPDRDGVGRLTLYEPMMTFDFADGLDTMIRTELATPAEFFTADRYPTSYVVQPTGDGGVYLYLDDFEPFPGPSE